MPIYEYQCSACGHQLEAIQKISDAPLKNCPECGKDALAKQISAPAFRLSGTGWYETDFKSDKEKRRNIASADKSSDSGKDKADKAAKQDKTKSDSSQASSAKAS